MADNTATPDGCPWIIRRSRKWDAKKKAYRMIPEFCHKLPEAGSQHCPKHTLYAAAKASQEQIERVFSASSTTR